MEEQKYQKLEHAEHIYKLPDTYIGSIESTTEEMFVFNQDRMVKQKITYVPGFFKIFDEILVNAIDHRQRDSSVKNIKIEIKKGVSEIIIQNDGNGIDVEIHPMLGIYIPEMLFGHLLTSSNYNEKEKRTTGGKNGYGATLVAIFSTYFIVETIDAVRQLKYTQYFTENNKTIHKPVIRSFTGKPYTKIKFAPDYKKFGLEQGITDDIYALLERRVYDTTATTPEDLNIYLNGSKLKIKSMEKYIQLFVSPGFKIFYEQQPRWKIGLVLSPNHEYNQISFVNGIWTSKGGRHVDYILNSIVEKIRLILGRLPKTKNKAFKPSQIKDHIWLFIDSIIENPSFSSQTKEEMTTRSTQFGSECKIDEKWVERWMKYQNGEDSFLSRMIQHTKVDEEKLLKKTDGTKKNTIRGIPKLEDALHAGTRNSQKCTLILTEGDSAKSSILAGVSALGSERDYYGIFPLRGKFINVREMNIERVNNNEEVKNLKNILGLQHGKVYTKENLKELRYGSISICADSDCLTYDTPLLIQNLEGGFDIKSVDNLTEEWIQGDGDIFYGSTDFKIWSDQGWTKIVKIVKKRTTKKMFRILTHTGCVDVTEDHPLLTHENVSITPIECSIGTDLNHSFPMFSDNRIDIPDNLEKMSIHDIYNIASKAKIQYYNKKSKDTLVNLLKDIKNKQYYDLNQKVWFGEDEAYVMGLFQTDGTCGIYKWIHKNVQQKNRPRPYDINRTNYSWSISNIDRTKLEKSMEIMNRIYELEFKIIEDRTHEKRGYSKAYKLIVNGGIKTKEFIEKYRSLFYDHHKFKRIPSCILNAPRNIRERFEQGIFDGDGSRSNLEKKGTRGIDVFGKIGAQGLYFLYKSLGYEVSMNIRKDKPNVYSLSLTKGQQADPIKIKKIVDLGYTDQYVYDLETENHHLQAGIGQLIVHNCDGSHIKGLIMNFLHYFWPSLLSIDGFLKTYYTPIIKGFYKNQSVSFYTSQEYNQFRETQTHKNWTFKYYKGLGTSTSKEFKEYFQQLPKITSYYTLDNEQELLLAFSKDKADQRKEWLKVYDPEEVIQSKKEILISDFIHKELKHFSNYDNHRSIPNALDGLKPSQRKVLYGILKKQKQEIKVAQLASYVSETTNYHHGEVSLEQTIVGMCQYFVGKNNLPLLKGVGQFGTRIMGGKDNAQSRYIFTETQDYTRNLFCAQDDPLLEYLVQEDKPVEPFCYYPLLPMVLINGSEGIGTGYSSFVPCFNIKEILEELLQKNQNNEPFKENWIPYYKNYTGYISSMDNTYRKFSTTGSFGWKTDNILLVKELPIGLWTNTFKEHLEHLIEQGIVNSYINKSTDEQVYFEITIPKPEKLLDRDLLIKTFKFQTTLSLNNMHLYRDQVIHKFQSVKEILEYFYEKRLEMYVKRKDYILKNLKEQISLLEEKIRFIQLVLDNPDIVFRRTKKEIFTELKERMFTQVETLIQLPIYNWSTEKIEEYKQDLRQLNQQYETYNEKTIQQLYTDDLLKLKDKIC